MGGSHKNGVAVVIRLNTRIKQVYEQLHTRVCKATPMCTCAFMCPGGCEGVCRCAFVPIYPLSIQPSICPRVYQFICLSIHVSLHMHMNMYM